MHKVAMLNCQSVCLSVCLSVSVCLSLSPSLSIYRHAFAHLVSLVSLFILQLAHPVLDSLRGTDKEWIVNLLYAFNAGKHHFRTQE